MHYNDYVLLLASVDAEWSRKHNEGFSSPIDPVLIELTSHCQRYRTKFENLHRKWAEAGVSTEPRAMAPYLLNPACFQPLSHADAFAAIICGDFDEVHDISTSCQRPIEDLCLAFCPVMTQFAKHSARPHLFVDLHMLMGDDAAALPLEVKDQPIAVPGCVAVYRPAIQDAFKKAPVLLFSKLKLTGLASVGAAGLFVEALYDAMAMAIDQCLNDLEKSDNLSLNLYDAQDINSTCVAFLDLQGQEEIGLFIAGTNLSVAMALISRLRVLKIQEVFAQDPAIEKLIRCQYVGDDDRPWLRGCASGLRAAFEEVAPPAGVDAWNVDSVLQKYQHTPVFRWTNSTASVAIDGLAWGENSPNIRGSVSAKLSVQVAPGFQRDVEKKLGEILSHATAESKAMERISLHHLGVNDLVYNFGACAESAKRRYLIATGRAVETLRTIMEHFSKPGAQASYRDMVGLTMEVSIPVPLEIRVECDDVFDPLHAALHKVRERLLEVRWLAEPHQELKKAVQESYSELNYSLMSEVPKIYGIPKPLARAISSFFQNYMGVVANSHLFDLALDLYDAIATLHKALVLDLPIEERAEGKLRKPVELGWCGIDPRKITQIARYVGALQQAFEHRLSHAFPDSSVRDMALDFRGGLTQFLFAADAPLKVGVGVARHDLVKDGMGDCRSIGIFTEVGFNPGIRAVRLNIGTENSSRLAFFETDVPHLLHVSSYVDYLHEAFHIVFEQALSHRSEQDQSHEEYKHWRELTPQLSQIQSQNDPDRVRASEVFVHALTYLLLSPGERTTYLRYFVARYSEDPESNGQPAVGTMATFAEVFMTLFVATGIPKNFWEETLPDGSPEIRDYRLNREELEKQFGDDFADAAAFFRSYALLKQDQRADTQEYCRKHFQSRLFGDNPLEGYFNEALRMALTVYHGISNKSVANSKGSYHERWLGTRQRITQSHKGEENSDVNRQAGCPIHLFWREDGGYHEVDSIVLTCAMLYEYICPIKDVDITKVHVHLPRCPDTGDISWNPLVNYNSLLIDQGAAVRFCACPSQRRARIQRQIRVIRSFWSMSAIFRTRRLAVLLRGPKETKSEWNKEKATAAP